MLTGLNICEQNALCKQCDLNALNILSWPYRECFDVCICPVHQKCVADWFSHGYCYGGKVLDYWVYALVEGFYTQFINTIMVNNSKIFQAGSKR